MIDVAMLHDAIAAVCPIDGVSIGDAADKASWRVAYAAKATDGQKAAAQAIVAAIDPGAFDQTVLSQDLMAQFTVDDATKIQSAIAGNVQFWLLWSAMQAQSEPMLVTNARFLTGWGALMQVLGAPRMAAIAAALDITIS